jgi:hypothetical protein
MESAINLEFLARTTENKYFDQFVEYSLGPERELYDMIQSNIEARKAKVWPIEKRMLDSISNVCNASGLKIVEVERKHREWAENLRQRLKTLGKENQYVAMQRIPSHAIHGTSTDLVLHHLEYDDKASVFRPNVHWSSVDARLLGPTAVLVLEALEPYIERFLTAISESKLLSDRLHDLRDRILKADAAHEKLMNANVDLQ